ncbi:MULTISPECIES: polyprenyl synthetase family protein [Thermomonospora]|uniref:Geranylgeranyl diphosphate synthase type I n=1 Tax=Thermomonospora cellulosilytica TaxID=1411118 RepID=A0A7W3MWL9_9ACTN|nr:MULTISPECIES: polyprenyl synthetase family protein [Thermomonospora]MBA9003157.1 geranylgeranyl diphosphate synthase type I [Thermomonospora cellulosilytica]
MTETTTLGVRPLRLDVIERVERRLTAFLDAERERWAAVDGRGAVLVDAVTDLVRAGGKRLRPAFCVSGFLAAGGDPADERIVDCAAGLELVHASALIHDDVLDDAELRRGKPAVHTRHTAEHAARGWHGESRRYGEGVAILAGDLATMYADRLAACLPPAARQVWGVLTTEVVIGQYLDVAVAAEGVADPELSRWVAVCKSGRYSIHRPLELGATLAGRPDLAGAFAEYGEALGEAFQLRDDLIDACGDQAAAGKPVGHDLAQHKMTLLLALAARRDEEVRALVEAPRWDVDALRERLVASGFTAEIERRIDALVDRARGALEAAPIDGAWRRELADMALEVAYRDR